MANSTISYEEAFGHPSDSDASGAAGSQPDSTISYEDAFNLPPPKGLRQTGALQREGMRRAGETQRTNINALH